jgi:hypothetical protein
VPRDAAPHGVPADAEHPRDGALLKPALDVEGPAESAASANDRWNMRAPEHQPKPDALLPAQVTCELENATCGEALDDWRELGVDSDRPMGH